MIRQTENEKEIGHIPSAMISISYKGRDPSEWAIRDLASRIYFYTETEVRIITKEGLDCVLDWRTHEVKSAAAVDHFTVDDFSDNHALLEQAAAWPQPGALGTPPSAWGLHLAGGIAGRCPL